MFNLTFFYHFFITRLIMQTSKYRSRTSPMYQTRENSREMSLYNREELSYGEDSRGERFLRERGRSRSLRVPALSERNDREREKRRERSVSEDYRDYRDTRRGKRSKRSESREIRNQEGDCYINIHIEYIEY